MEKHEVYTLKERADEDRENFKALEKEFRELKSLYDKQSSFLKGNVDDNKKDINNIGKELRANQKENDTKFEYHGKKITQIVIRMTAASAVVGAVWLALQNYKAILPG